MSSNSFCYEHIPRACHFAQVRTTEKSQSSLCNRNPEVDACSDWTTAESKCHVDIAGGVPIALPFIYSNECLFARTSFRAGLRNNFEVI